MRLGGCACDYVFVCRSYRCLCLFHGSTSNGECVVCSRVFVFHVFLSPFLLSFFSFSPFSSPSPACLFVYVFVRDFFLLLFLFVSLSSLRSFVFVCAPDWVWLSFMRLCIIIIIVCQWICSGEYDVRRMKIYANQTNCRNECVKDFRRVFSSSSSFLLYGLVWFGCERFSEARYFNGIGIHPIDSVAQSRRLSKYIATRSSSNGKEWVMWMPRTALGHENNSVRYEAEMEPRELPNRIDRIISQAPSARISGNFLWKRKTQLDEARPKKNPEN